MKTIKFSASLLCLFFLLSIITACKPTEKNYQQAYDAAQRKREAVDLNQVADADGHKVIGFDAPQSVTVGSRTMNVISAFTKPIDETPSQSSHQMYMVAVGKYHMPTNARAQAATLVEQGFEDAHAVTDGKDNYYAVVGGFNSLPDAAECVEKLEKNYMPGFFIGLSGQPLLIRSPR